MQEMTVVLPAGELESAGQPRQPEEPVSALYVPSKHCEHVAPSAPVYPALHWQAVSAVLCTGEFEFAGQVVQQLTFTFFRL
jgi:hypothetical protein